MAEERDLLLPASSSNEEGKGYGTLPDAEFSRQKKIANLRKAQTSETRRRWASLCVVFAGQFAMFVQGSIYWVSLWPYLSQVDTSVPESFQGFVIAAYNVGTVIASPLFGYWSNRIKQTRLPIMVGILINMSGCLLFAFVEGFPMASRRWVFLLARFIAGVGSGNQAPLQAYVAMATTMKERNRAFSINAATVSLAVLLGPGLQSLMQPIGYPGVHTKSFFLNMYTAPAYFSVVVGAIVGILFLTVFKEYHVSVEDQSDITNYLANLKDKKLRPFDKLAVFNCVLVRFVMLFCVSYDDTVGSPFTMAMFNWNRSQAVLYNGIIGAVSGVMDFAGNLLVGNIVLRYFKERTVIVIGLFFFCSFYLISFSWPGLPVYPPDIRPDRNLTAVEDVAEVSGCYYAWCGTTPRIYLAQYLVAFGCLVLAFSLAFTPTSTLYSKVLGPIRQGTMQGVFVAAGNLGMTISPILVSYLFEYYGPRIAWAFAACLTAATILSVSLSFKRMIPYHERYPDQGEMVDVVSTLTEREAERKRRLSRRDTAIDYDNLDIY